jgi:hypothetical protein
MDFCIIGTCDEQLCKHFQVIHHPNCRHGVLHVFSTCSPRGYLRPVEDSEHILRTLGDSKMLLHDRSTPPAERVTTCFSVGDPSTHQSPPTSPVHNGSSSSFPGTKSSRKKSTCRRQPAIITCWHFADLPHGERQPCHL